MTKSLFKSGDDRASVVLRIFVLGIILSAGLNGVDGQLSVDFYNKTCPIVQTVVHDIMLAHFLKDKTIAAHVLRLQFHDCAATGCDASLLMTGPDSEQVAPPNLTLEGFDVINSVKRHVEGHCTGIVSCSDIMALAAKEAVLLTGGPNFSVPLGRFDSNFSAGPNVNLPSPSFSVPETITFFRNLGLSIADLVILLGAHTLGVAHCSSFSDRLFNFNGTGEPDPSIAPTFLTSLRTSCPKGNTNATITVPLDTGSEFVFDSHFYSQMIQGHGVLQIDEEIFTSDMTNATVNQLTNNTLFFQKFANSLIKMGQIGVKNSTAGSVRLNCSVVANSTVLSSTSVNSTSLINSTVNS